MIHTRSKAHLLQCFLGKFKSILLVIHFQGETHVFQSIEVGHQMKLLKDDTDVFRPELSQFFLGHRIQMAFFQFKGSGSRLVQSCQQRQKGRFPASGLSNDGGGFSLFHFEFKTFEYFHGGGVIDSRKGFGQIFNIEQHTEFMKC